MSYILDALRRSEEDRRRQKGFDFDLAEPQHLSGRRRRSRMSSLLALALLLNAAVLGVWLLRDGAGNDGARAITAMERPAERAIPADAAAPVPEPIEVQPAAEAASPPVDWSAVPLRSLNALSAAERRRFERLRISTHVYAEDSTFREVGIDGRVYREGDRIDGMTLVAITASGIRLGVDDQVIVIDLQDQWNL